jgi:hypothetical protein
VCKIEQAAGGDAVAVGAESPKRDKRVMVSLELENINDAGWVKRVTVTPSPQRPWHLSVTESAFAPVKTREQPYG